MHCPFKSAFLEAWCADYNHNHCEFFMKNLDFEFSPWFTDSEISEVFKH